MRTSKKLLSLFLAVVMIVSTCSVGFTAFAADKSSTNNTYWNNSTNADDTFKALNELVDTYVPQLVNIPAIKTLLENSLGMTVTDDTSIQDVVAGVSPTLIGALGSKGDKKSIIPNYSELSKYYYSYLDGTESDSMDFYQLYQFCTDNMYSSDKDLKKYCEETLPKLQDLLNVYSNAQDEVTKQNACLEDYIQSFIDDKNDGKDYPTSLYEIENYNYNGTLLKDIKDNECQPLMDTTNASLEKIGSDIKITNVAQLIYYTHSFDSDVYSGLNTVTAQTYLYLANLVDTDIKYNDTVLTNGNYVSIIKSSYTLDNYLLDNSIDQDEYNSNKDLYDSKYSSEIDHKFANIIAPAIDTDEDYDNGFITTEYYNAINQGLLKETGIYEDPAKEYNDSLITHDQLVAMAKAASDDETGWGEDNDQMIAYLNSESCVLSNTAINYILSNADLLDRLCTLLSDSTTEIDGLDIVYGGDVYTYADLIDDAPNYLADLGFAQAVNYMLMTQMNIDAFGKGYLVSGGKGFNAYDAFSLMETFTNQVKPVIDDKGASYKYSDYAIPDSCTVSAANDLLNSKINEFLDPNSSIGSLVTGAITGLLQSDVDLQASLTDVLKNLYDKPVDTVFNLLPILVILVDEVVEPIVLCSDTDRYGKDGGFLYGILCAEKGDGSKGMLQDLTQDSGSSVGIGALNFDLNKIVPAALNWLIGTDKSKAEAIKLVGQYTGTVYDNKVPKFTNIYVVDHAICYANIDDLGKNNEGLSQALKELVSFANDAVNSYLKDHGDDAKLDNDGGVANKGLNNVFAALPQVIDYMGKAFMKKYNVNSDWTYCYDGKITYVKNDNDEVIDVQNKTVQDFKALAKENDGSKVLNQFVNMFVGNWFNGLLDFLNDVTKDTSKDNKITSEIPVISGLLQSLGGLGEKSIITDVFNGFFQLKRSDKASFTLELRKETGFVGFSNESGFALLSNLQYEKNGNQQGIIPFVMTLTAQDTTNSTNTSNNATTLSNSPVLASKSAAGTDYSKLLTSSNEKAAQDLVKSLDSLLSTLLKNSSLNGFTLTSTDGLLSAVASVASNYLGAQNTNDIVKLVNNYLYYVVDTNKATSSGKVDDKKVYSSANLSNLVVQTYSLVENIVGYLFYNSSTGLLNKNDPNMLVADAVNGVISPDSVAVRLSSKYSKTAKVLENDKYKNWNDFKVEITATTASSKSGKDLLNYGFKAGDKTQFYNALAESLGSVTAILGTVLTCTYTDKGRTKNYYSEVVYPVLDSVSKANGVKSVMSPASFNKATDADRLVKGLLTPISQTLDKIYKAPASMLLNTIKGVAGVLKDDKIKGIINSALIPINNEINGVGNIVNYLAPAWGSGIKGNIKVDLPKSNIIVSLINNAQSFIKLPVINWTKLATAKNPAQVLLLIYGYAVDTILNSDMLQSLLADYPSILDAIKNLTASQILGIVKDVLSVASTPTEAYWTFSQYTSKLTNSFIYPMGINSSDANKAVDQLDGLVANVFPLLQGLGVADIEGLPSLVNGALYKNELLTTIATALYGAIDTDTVRPILSTLNIDVTPKGVAAILTNKSYGTTYSSAAATLKKAKSWKSVKSLNWGFTNGSAKAQTGFINGLAAILRPFNSYLSVLLAEGNANLQDSLVPLVKQLSLQGETPISEGEYGATLKYSLKNSIFTLTVKSNSKKNKNEPSVSTFKINVAAVAKELEKTVKNTNGFGSNGYESAVIPLLEAFMCNNVKTYSQYKKDYAKSKDSLLTDILNPLFGFVNEVLDAPFATITKVLPNVAHFIDGNGISQVLNNLLAPLTAKDGLLGVLSKHGFNIDTIIESILGEDLGEFVSDLLSLKTPLNLRLTELYKCNIQDFVIPIVNSVLDSNNLGIKIPEFKWSTIASHGSLQTVSSKAKNAQGTYTTKQVKANQGETLVAVLRYVSDVLITNSTAIDKILVNIDGIKKNVTVKNIIDCVFAQIKVAGKDDIVHAVFYLLQEQVTNSFFDYSNFTYKTDYKFSYGSMDEDFCRKLGPMLDGLVGGLADLNDIVFNKLVYKDNIVATIATALYGAVENVKVGDGSLTSLLAQTGIDFSTSNVAALLTDTKYGKTFESAASTIKSAGSWKNVNKDNLKFGVKDRETFLNALCSVLRPIYPVLDVLLNSSSLNLFNMLSIPGSDGYTSTLVPLMEALNMYNIKTQYQYREDIFKAYDNILLDVLNPIMDKAEDLLAAPIETLTDLLPNLSLFFANDGLLQLVDNLLTPVTALLNAVKPIVDVNKVLAAINVDIPGLLKKAGLNVNMTFDVYDLSGSIKPLVGSANVVSTINSIIGSIKIKGTALNLVLPDIDWFKLASHGEIVLNCPSQVAALGNRISVKADADETLIAVLRFLIDTVNYKGNYNAICNLISGLLGDSVSDSISDIINQVLGMLQGDSDEVINTLVDFLQQLAG